MKKILPIAFLILPYAAFAQQPAPAQQFDIKLTFAQLQVIGTALTKRPYEEVAELLANLNSQIAAQQKPVNPAVTPSEPGK